MGVLFGDKLKQLRLERNMSQEELAGLLGTSKQVISRYETNQRTPKITIAQKYAIQLGIPLNYLINDDISSSLKENVIDIPNIKNIFPLKTKKIPLIGTIAAGVPLLAEEQFECYVETSDNIKADFCLRVKGDSMVNARINDGDIVFIIKQPDVDDGEIAAVLIDSEATLKRVYKMPGAVKLVAENSKYKPLLYTENNCDELIILGKAIAFQSKVH